MAGRELRGSGGRLPQHSTESLLSLAPSTRYCQCLRQDHRPKTPTFQSAPVQQHVVRNWQGKAHKAMSYPAACHCMAPRSNAHEPLSLQGSRWVSLMPRGVAQWLHKDEWILNLQLSQRKVSHEAPRVNHRHKHTHLYHCDYQL